MRTTTTVDAVERVIADRVEIPLADFAALLGISLWAAQERHRRGTLGVAVRQVKPSRDGKRGSGLFVPAYEVRRYVTGPGPEAA